jgi:hypothetical protein
MDISKKKKKKKKWAETNGKNGEGTTHKQYV